MASRKPRHKPRKPAAKSPRQKRSSKPNSNIGRDFEKLVAVMARLRAPGGCPWDREQTHATLRTYLIEEAYEVLDALDSTDDSKFAEELGDLLLQVLFHAQIAREEHRFSITDVIREIHDKMVRRHPHVFGDTTAKTAADVLRNWEIIKKQERAAKSRSSATVLGAPSFAPSAKGGSALRFSAKEKAGTGSDVSKSQTEAAPAPEESVSILDGVPRTLPALLEALQLTRKAARIGFDWPNVDGIFAKLTEETHELQHALAANVPAGLQIRQGESLSPPQSALVAQGESASPAAVSTSPANNNPSSRAESAKRGISPKAPEAESSQSSRIESELGDLLFVLVNLARFLHVDPELALKKTSAKFARRFHRMEQFAREKGTTLAQVPRDQLESFWDRAKLLE